MILSSIIHSNTGLIHLVFSIIAMITGGLVIGMKKGTTLHKRIGYIYSVSMIGLLMTAFMIYYLFDAFGIFHYMAVVSTITLIGGIVPAILKKPQERWLSLHYSFMFWSVAGLYAAFISEVLTRMPEQSWTLFMVAMFVFFGIVNIFWFKYKKKWNEYYNL